MEYVWFFQRMKPDEAGVSGLQRCLWAWTGPPCSALPGTGGCTRPLLLSLPFPVPGNTLRWLMKLEEFLGRVESHQRQATREPSQPACPGGMAVHFGPAFLGGDFSLGSWRVPLLSLLDSAFVLNMKSFPSCRPRAFSFCFYHPIPSKPSPTPSPMLGTWLRFPHPSSSTGSPTYLRKPKPSRGVFGPFLPSLGGLGEGVSTVPPYGQLSDPGCWPVHSTAGM